MSVNLLSKYRPTSLDDVLGQATVVRALKQFVKQPYEVALLFHGESGVGKTSAAVALAHDLGVAVNEGSFGGFLEIASGELAADTVRQTLGQLRLRPMYGSGWRVLVANECDRMLTPVETIFLDALEHLPSKTVVVFTTNIPERLTKRFRDRCETYHFTCETKKLRPHIKKLAERVWQAEVGAGQVPKLDTLGMPTLQGPDAMHCSFRLALQQLSRLVREAISGGEQLAAVAEQLDRDVVPEADFEAVCDHCNHAQDVPFAATEHLCEQCGQAFQLER